jgi:hypothetical protein
VKALYGLLGTLIFFRTARKLSDRFQYWDRNQLQHCLYGFVSHRIARLMENALIVFRPGLIASLWGMQNIGRNFGIMMYAPFTGTPLFSYIYALVSASHQEDGEMICRGRLCWQSTLYFAIVTSFVSLLVSLVLWRRWRGGI